MNCAPVVIFVYNRPWHTRQTIEALSANEGVQGTDLIIYSDGPKSPDAIEQVNEVRHYLSGVRGFKSVSIVLRDTNLGLAKSIIDGVTEVLKKYNCVIVIEDDLVTSPYFLQYMNDALEFYQNVDRVVSIHGYLFPVKKLLPETFFLKGADCWGWATWRRGWANFNPNGEWLFSELHRLKLTSEFDFKGTYEYTTMLKDQIDGNNDSWAVRWYASAFLHNKLTLYPGRSLVQNIGFDSSGVHCEVNRNIEVSLSATPVRVEVIPVEDSKVGRKAFINFFRSQHARQNLRIVISDIIHKLTRYF